MSRDLKRTHRKSISFIIACLLILILFLIPYIKLTLYYYHYEFLGSYAITTEELTGLRRSSYSGINLKPIHLNKSFYEVTDKKIGITNILYYDSLNQLSFGFLTNKDKNKDYQLIITDKNENDLGNLKTYGTPSFYNKQIEKLIFDLNQPLIKNESYKIEIKNIQGDIAGNVFFELK